MIVAYHKYLLLRHHSCCFAAFVYYHHHCEFSDRPLVSNPLVQRDTVKTHSPLWASPATGGAGSHEADTPMSLLVSLHIADCCQQVVSMCRPGVCSHLSAELTSILFSQRLS